MPVKDDGIRFFPTPADFRKWLSRNHGREKELWVGFHKKGSGKPSITWPESVDEALCFGWIDGVRMSVDSESYKIRFTPRKPQSNWSALNIRRAQQLIEAGRMKPAGSKAFQARTEAKSEVYSYEQRPQKLPDEYERVFRAKRKAWAFFESQAPWYRRVCAHWVASAKREETRRKRLAILIEDSAREQRLGPMNRKK